MKLFRLIFILLIASLLNACAAPAASLVGSAITRMANKGIETGTLGDSNSAKEKKIAVANLELGLAYMQQGQYKKALEKLQRAKKAKSDYAPIYTSLGLLHQRLREPGKAEIYFKKALSLEPNNPSYLNTYASFLCPRDYSQAEEFFLMAATNPLYTTPEHAWSNAGTCAYRNKQEDKAEDFFKNALRSNPQTPPALMQMAELYYAKNDFQTAQHYLDRHQKIVGYTAKGLLMGVQVEKELGDRDKASSYALLLRYQFPDTEEARVLEDSNLYNL